MNPPKPRATPEDALELLWAFLTKEGCHPPHYDKKKLTKELRGTGKVVPKDLSAQLKGMCDIRRRSEEYRIHWLKYMGVENPKTFRQEFKEFYDTIKNRAKKKSR